jgi:succinyl-CoA synthetase beta subunit
LSHLYSEINSESRQILYYEHTRISRKEILASYGVRIQRGIVANNAVEAVAAAKQLTTETGTSWFVIKAQVHAGGRKWRSKTCQNLQQVERVAGQIIGMQWLHLKLLQKVKKVHKVLVAEDVYYLVKLQNFTYLFY